ncbi:MAG: ATP synthase F1 subunit gamma [Bdellovibrionaceae bacterium]|nr:ATP synthase F1 subunit gamma [Pseudobdellovibrionaceae bacterium]
MSNMKDIRSRITSVTNTQQITKAMKMVSAAKLSKAQAHIINMRPYAQQLRSLISRLVKNPKIQHPFLEKKDKVENILLVVVSGDRGLCGGFNTTVNRFAENFLTTEANKYKSIGLFLIGKKAIDYFKARQIEAVESVPNVSKELSYKMAVSISNKLMHFFKTNKYDEIHFVYNEFKSVISQERVVEKIFPVEYEDSPDGQTFSDDYIFEPPAMEFLEKLLVKHFTSQVYRYLSESVAAEYAARMTAMDSATNNANDMIKKLTLTYNKLRQANITKELMEIVSGAEAVK